MHFYFVQFIIQIYSFKTIQRIKLLTWIRLKAKYNNMGNFGGKNYVVICISRISCRLFLGKMKRMDDLYVELICYVWRTSCYLSRVKVRCDGWNPFILFCFLLCLKYWAVHGKRIETLVDICKSRGKHVTYIYT